jgi:hypothetical protein
MGQADGKYWIANNPNSEVTDAKAQKVKDLSATSAVVGDLNAGQKVFSSVTALAAAGALARNTKYHLTDVDAAEYTLPAAASCTVGDRIEIVYIAILGAALHKYGTAGEFFAATSYVMKPMDSTGNSAYAVDVADGTGDDFLNITGASDAGWGIGTTLTFVFNGTQWHVECWGKATGNGSTAATGVFATT